MRKTSGISLMLLIFLSLCLMTFALLSLSGARADETLSRQAADRTTEYYAAEASASEAISAIQDRLAHYLTEASAADDPSPVWAEKCASLPDELPEIQWVVPEGSFHSAFTETGSLAFQVPVNDDQVLQVELAVEYPASAKAPLCQITAWQILNTGDWMPDTDMNLLRIEPQTE